MNNYITIAHLNKNIKYYSPGQLAKKYNYSRGVIYKWIGEGKLDLIKVGKASLIPETEIPTFLRLKSIAKKNKIRFLAGWHGQEEVIKS